VTTRPSAADDFTAIRTRMEELRRERDQIEAAQDGRLAIGPRGFGERRSESEPKDDRLLPRSFVRTSIR
jgi:hypothetical protein